MSGKGAGFRVSMAEKIRDLIVINREATSADERTTLVIHDDVADVFERLSEAVMI